jgi:hypothetical protein
VIEVADHEARGQSAVDLNSVIQAGLGRWTTSLLEMSVPSMTNFHPASMGKCSSSIMATL